MKGTVLLALALAGIGAYFLLQQKSTEDKRTWLKQWGASTASGLNDVAPWNAIVDRMTPAEIDDVYQFLTKFNEQKPVPVDNPLKTRLIAISAKYNIFT